MSEADGDARMDPNAHNMSRRRSFLMRPDENWRDRHWYDGQNNDEERPDVHVYTDQISFAPGEEVSFHASTLAPEWTLEIVRDGLNPEAVYRVEGIRGQYTPDPADSYRAGCNWPVLHRWRVPEEFPSGFYKVVASCQRRDGTQFVNHQFFVVRPSEKSRRTPYLMVLPTATWTAYNDWGGANHYAGIASASPVLNMNRPWRHGLVWMPEGAPRVVSERGRPIHAPPQYRMKEWSTANSFGQFAGASGWAQFDRHFLVWAERSGYEIDIITQTDLHFRPEILSNYACLIFVGHDEYWTKEMRDAVDAYVEAGGNAARFAGNFLWQIRLDEDGRTQTCYKYAAASEDPVAGTPDEPLLTGAWEDHRVGRPGASTFGVNALRGMYVSWGGFAPNGARGFTVYRPRHWAFENCGIRFGDLLGAESDVFAYEVDGLEFGFRDGLPYPLGTDGAPQGLDILAMSPACLAEDCLSSDEATYYVGDSDLRFAAEALDGRVTAESMARRRHGSGMIVSFSKGRGQVFTAATCEWVSGLTRRDLQVELVTKNVLNKFRDANFV